LNTRVSVMALQRTAALSSHSVQMSQECSGSTKREDAIAHATKTEKRKSERDAIPCDVRSK
jgi:hypothetical protein